jgi:hypothetical protein
MTDLIMVGSVVQWFSGTAAIQAESLTSRRAVILAGYT